MGGPPRGRPPKNSVWHCERQRYVGLDPPGATQPSTTAAVKPRKRCCASGSVRTFEVWPASTFVCVLAQEEDASGILGEPTMHYATLTKQLISPDLGDDLSMCSGTRHTKTSTRISGCSWCMKIFM